MTVTELHPDLDQDGRDPRTEAWLDDLHVPWRYDPAMPLDQVDQEASLANQARLHSLDPDVVERYAADMARGDQFPPLLALTRKRRKAMLLGGNHRYTSAIKAKRMTVAVYVVDAEPEMATRLMYEDNRRHGLPPSDEERIAQAIHLIDTGWTEKAAAECVGISSGKVARARAVSLAQRRARQLSIGTAWASIPKSAQWRLGSIRSDPVFIEAVKLVGASGIDATKTYELVTKLNECRSEAAAMELIGTETEILRSSIQSRAGGAHQRQPVTPRVRLLHAVSAMAGCDPIDVAAGCANAEQAKSLARQLVDVRKRLDDTLRALKERW
jgi:hypothetical protein